MRLFVLYGPVPFRKHFLVRVPSLASAMTRVFAKQELEAAAAKATEASPQDVLKRFYVPIVGTLRCKYIGPHNSEEKDVIVFNTNVAFKWEFSSPHVKGSIEQAFCSYCRCCCLCSHM